MSEPFEIGPPAPVEAPAPHVQRKASAEFERMMRRAAEKADIKTRQERSRRGVRVFTLAERAAAQPDPLVEALRQEFSVYWLARPFVLGRHFPLGERHTFEVRDDTRDRIAAAPPEWAR